MSSNDELNLILWDAAKVGDTVAVLAVIADGADVNISYVSNNDNYLTFNDNSHVSSSKSIFSLLYLMSMV